MNLISKENEESVEEESNETTQPQDFQDKYITNNIQEALSHL